MSPIAWLRKRLRLDREDFQDEIAAHLAMAAQERMAEGADPETARLQALKEFGNLRLTTEAAHQVWTPRWLDALHDLARDVRYALRSLAKNPVFTFTVVGVLALGIGVNAAVFTMLKSMALTPLSGVDRSIQLHALYGETGAGRVVRVSYPDYRYLRDHDNVFSGLMGSGHVPVYLGRGRASRQVSAELVTGNYFQVLGVRAELGRTLLPSDEISPGGPPVAVLNDGLWRRDFGADPEIVGKTVEVNNTPLTVVGVADPTFHGTIASYDVELFLPVMMAAQLGLGAPDVLSDSRAGLLFPHGYLRPDTTPADAVAGSEALWATLSRDRPATDAAQRLRVVPFWKSPTGGQTYVMPTLVLLSAMGLLVLTIACANIAGLVLVRGMSRRGEIAVRQAIGATRTRVVRLLVVENLVLALPGAALGLLLAWRGVPMLTAAAQEMAWPQRLFFNSQVDALVVGFSALVGCGCALVFGFVPALRSSRVELVSAINEDASPRTAGRGGLRAALVIAQVAVSLLLLVGAGLMSRSLDAARRAHPGFDAGQVTALVVDVKQNAYDEARGRAFYRSLLETARADPGVESATLAELVPMAFLPTRSRRVAIEGYQPRPGEDLATMSNTVGSDYFETLRIKVVAGRGFEESDDEKAAPVAVVNETLAQRFWGGAANAIGKRIRAGDGDWRTVVGVAADVKYLRIDEPPRPYFYLPFPQAYRSSMILHTRGTGPVDQLVEKARARVAALDGDLPILSAKPLAEETANGLVFLNFTSSMLSFFGLAGMALAALGIYGLVSYTVKQSTHEIGIRTALGASRLSVVRSFFGRGLRLGAIGAVLGCLAALAVSRLLGGLLFGVSATDAVSFLRAVALVLGGVAVATIVPAWSAALTNPLKALRHQ